MKQLNITTAIIISAILIFLSCSKKEEVKPAKRDQNYIQECVTLWPDSISRIDTTQKEDIKDTVLIDYWPNTVISHLSPCISIYPQSGESEKNTIPGDTVEAKMVNYYACPSKCYKLLYRHGPEFCFQTADTVFFPCSKECYTVESIYGACLPIDTIYYPCSYTINRW